LERNILENRIKLQKTIKKLTSEINEIHKIKENYRITKHKILEEPIILTQDLYIGKNTKDIENFLCSICIDIVNNPIQCSDCEHFFCEGCINKHVFIKNDCPNCKTQPFSKEKICRLARVFLEKLEFDCPMKCKEIIKFFDAEKHKSICSKIKDIHECNLCQMQMDYVEDLKEKHLLECRELKISCDFCKKEYNKFDFETHLEACNKYCFNCDKCKMNFPIIYRDSHNNFFCEEIKNCLDKLKDLLIMF